VQSSALIGYYRRVSQSAMSDAEEARKYPYWERNLLVLPCANVLCALGFTISFPFLPLMVRGLGVTDNLETWIGTMMLVFYVVSFASNPVWGGIADHYGRKIMVLRAMLGMGGAMALVPLAPSPLWFAALFCLIGLCNGFTPAGMALLVANTPPRKIGTALSFAQTGGLVGQTMGPAVGTLLAALVAHHHTLFWFSSSLMLCGGLLVLFFVHEIKQLAPGKWRLNWIGSLRELLAVPRLGQLYLLSFLFTVMWSGNITIVSLYMIKLNAAGAGSAGDDAFWVGAAAMALALSSVVVLPFWGRVIDRYGPARVMAFAGAAAVVTHLPLLILETPLQLVLARIAFGLTAAAMHPAVIQLLRANAPDGMDARAISYATSFQFFAMGIAPFLAGIIGPLFGLRVYFALTIVALSCGLVMWMRRKN
jgi:MFS family permease